MMNSFQNMKSTMSGEIIISAFQLRVIFPNQSILSLLFPTNLLYLNLLFHMLLSPTKPSKTFNDNNANF